MLKEPSNTFAKNTLLMWNIQSDAHFVRGVENFVYRTNDSSKYLRLTLPSHRKKEEIEAELRWMDLLSKNSISVTHPYLSQNSNFVEEVSYKDQILYATLFSGAPGRPPEKKEDYNPGFLNKWGAYVGALHNFSNQSSPYQRRPWDKEPGVILADSALSKEEGHCYEVYKQLRSYLNTLPKNDSCYGLIHADLHQGNFFITEDYKITAFDFDDSQNHWHIYDLATILISLKSMFKRNQWNLDYKNIFTHILDGYKVSQPLEPLWEQRIIAFAYWREALIYFWSKGRMENNEMLSENLSRVHQMREEISKSLLSFSSSMLV